MELNENVIKAASRIETQFTEKYSGPNSPRAIISYQRFPGDDVRFPYAVTFVEDGVAKARVIDLDAGQFRELQNKSFGHGPPFCQPVITRGKVAYFLQGKIGTRRRNFIENRFTELRNTPVPTLRPIFPNGLMHHEICQSIVIAAKQAG